MITGTNPVLLKVTYVRPSRKRRGMPDDGTPERKECFQVIYIDDQGQVRYTEEPGEADIYFVKPEYRTYRYNKPQERMEHMYKVRCPISKIRYRIAEEAGEWGSQIIQRAYQTRELRYLNQLYRWPYCFGCDFQPEYYFMKNFYERFPLSVPKLSKGFMDIEIDQIDYIVDMENVEDTAYAPVNLVTVILDSTKEAYTFVLRPQEPSHLGRSEEEYQARFALYQKQLEAHEYQMKHLDEFYARCHQEFDQVYGHLSYHIRDYVNEIDLISDVFRFINTRKPNFVELWNMRFDIAYLHARIQVLGYDPASVMCHPNIPSPMCYFSKDRSTFMIEKQYDYFYCTSFTQYICQMRLYASIRKSQHTLKSVALNAIGDRELRDRKVEYPDQTNIRTFPYRDWILFWLYNIKDVLIQLGIERKTNDITTYYMRSHSNMTPYNKIFKETHLLRNVREVYFEKDGWVQGNNLNIIDEQKDETASKFYGSEEEEDQSKASFKGAINAEPSWNAYVGLYLLGARTNNLFKNTVDFDMGAFYPSIKIASNMDPATMYGKAAFVNAEFQSGEFTNRSLNQAYFEKDKYGNVRALDFTGEAVNTYVSGNTLTFGYNYLNLPSITTLEQRVLEKLCA